jgi:hypothetical protein
MEALPLHTLTSDGASVMISEKQGVLEKLSSAVNSKMFATHCPPHRLVLACKGLPNDVERTVSDTLFFFKDSAVR